MPRFMPAAVDGQHRLATIYWGYLEEGETRAGGMRLTLSVNGEIEVVNAAVLAEDLVEVVFVDILGQPLDNNLHNFRSVD